MADPNYGDNRIPLDDDDDEFPGPDETVPADGDSDPLGPTRMLAYCILASLVGFSLTILYKLLTLEVIAP